jgi:hypothetical protein
MIVRLAAHGWPRRVIAAYLGVGRKTVRRYMRQGGWRSRPSTSILDPFAPLLRTLAPQVGYKVAAATAAIRGQGYTGSSRTVARFLRELRGTFGVTPRAFEPLSHRPHCVPHPTSTRPRYLRTARP